MFAFIVIPISAKNHTCQPDPLKLYKILNNQTDKFLDSKYFSSDSNSSTIIQWSESNTLNQLWQFIPINQTAKIYLIVSIETMKGLTVTSSAFLQQWSYETENRNQHFQIEEQNGSCKIVNIQTQRSIVVNSNSNGAPIQTGEQQTSLWKLIQTGMIEKM